MFFQGVIFSLMLILFNNILNVQSFKQSTCIFTDYSQISTNDCLNVIIDSVVVPGGKTLNLDLQKGSTLTFRGNTSFSFFHWTGYLISIAGEDLVIRGEPGSFLDGQGQLYWDGNGEWGSEKPELLIIKCNNSLFENITVLNTPRHGITIQESHNLEFRYWLYNNSFGDEVHHPDGNFGHNTDGFNVKESTNIHIHHNDVYNQDDCVVVRSGENIYVSDMYCHNSHGLSISAGYSNESIFNNTVNNLTFVDSFVDGGENGIHIKSRKNGGFGSVSNVVYRNISFKGTSLSGINIQQNYMNLPAGSPMDPIPRGNVPFINITLENIFGTVADSAFGYYFNCAEGACKNFVINNVAVIGGNNNTCNINFPNFNC